MRSDPKTVYRNEWKYLIGFQEKEALKVRMTSLLQLDAHASKSGYTIRSLYFDDYWNRSYEEKLMGVLARKKYRIRIYNYSDQNIKLERKGKVGSYIYKESAPLTREETEKIIRGEYGFLLKSPHKLCQEFYVECISHMMRPKVMVDYEREPYIMDEGTVRITFDSHVRAPVLSVDIFDANLPYLDAVEPERLIMEVKFTEFLPQIIKTILPPASSEFTAVSKYVLCYEKTQYLNSWEYWKD